MALRWTESCAFYYNSSDVFKVYDEGRLDEGLSSTAGRRGNRCFVGKYEDRRVQKSFDSQQKWVIGMACYWTGFGNFRSGWLFRFYDGNTIQCGLHISSQTRLLSFRRGDDTILATSPAVVLKDSWYYIECEVFIDGTNGYFTVKLSGATIMSETSVNTQITANASADAISWGSAGVGGQNMYWHDLYACDGTGSKNNTFLGDVRVDALKVNAAGNYAQWTPFAGANYENIGGDYPDYDTTYNHTNTVGNKDTVLMDEIDSIGTTIHGVRQVIWARKDDVTGTRGFKPLLRQGSTDQLVDDEVFLPDSYTGHCFVYEDNPIDSSAWEEADVIGAGRVEFGYQLTS